MLDMEDAIEFCQTFVNELSPVIRDDIVWDAIPTNDSKQNVVLVWL